MRVSMYLSYYLYTETVWTLHLTLVEHICYVLCGFTRWFDCLVCNRLIVCISWVRTTSMVLLF